MGIFETLKKIKEFDFVVIGGYAVNAYALPRFSVDCDIVIKEKNNKLFKALAGYTKVEANDTYYAGEFLRYEKKIKKNFAVSIDILIKDILDRQTNSIFSSSF